MVSLFSGHHQKAGGDKSFGLEQITHSYIFRALQTISLVQKNSSYTRMKSSRFKVCIGTHELQDMKAVNTYDPCRVQHPTGNFTVMQKSSVAPTVSAEQSAEYFSLELLVANQAFVSRGLQHPLNNRTAPTVSCITQHKGQLLPKIGVDAKCVRLTANRGHSPA